MTEVKSKLYLLIMSVVVVTSMVLIGLPLWEHWIDIITAYWSDV